MALVLGSGSICWFEEGVTDSFGDGLEPIKCLGFLKGSNCPHYDGEVDRKPAYHNLVKSKEIQSGIATDDGVAIHFKEQEISKIVSSRPHAKAYRVASFEGTVSYQFRVESSVSGMVDLLVEDAVMVLRDEIATTAQIKFEFYLCLHGCGAECEKD